jgi:hypothetical protein
VNLDRRPNSQSAKASEQWWGKRGSNQKRAKIVAKADCHRLQQTIGGGAGKNVGQLPAKPLAWQLVSRNDEILLPLTANSLPMRRGRQIALTV